MTFKVEEHYLVPKHSVVPKEEEEAILKGYNVKKDDLPVILKSDAAIKKLKAKRGDIIKIERRGFTVKKSIYFRVVK